MTLHHSFTPVRLRKTAVVGALAALTATIAVAPAHAAEGSIVEVATGAEYVTAVDDASSSDSATTITLTADIQIPAGAEPEYAGAHDLTVDGAGYTVTPAELNEDSAFLFIYAGDEAHVTVNDITLQSFESSSRVIRASSGASLTVTDSSFLANGASGNSFNALDTSVPTVVSNSEFSHNSGTIYGTAIDASASLIIENSTFANNVSAGTVIESNGDLAISGSTFSDNSATSDAVVYTDSDAGITVANSTFTNNVSRSGALTLGSDSTNTVTHSTFANNTSVSAENGAHLTLWTDTDLTGNVFTGTGESTGCGWDEDATGATQSNFDADGSCTNDWADESNIGDGLDAQLGELANNGGATQTLLPAAGSPLIDAVPAGVSDLNVDQRGEARPAGDSADIGAVEVQPVVEDDEDEPGNGGEGDTGTVSFQVKTDGGTLYGTASAAVAVTDINWTSTANLTGAPANTALPYGAAGFTIEVPEPGASVTITLTAPKPFTAAYKVTDGEWSKIEGAKFSADGTTVTYTLIDGGDLDEDGEANGFIVDPVALAVQASFTG